MKKRIGWFLLSIAALFSLTSCDMPTSSIKGLPGEVYSTLIIVAVCLVIFLIIFLKVRKADPLKRPKGIVLLAEWGIEFIDNFVVNTMGKRFAAFAPYILSVAIYIFLAFTIGLVGLPSPMTYYIVPFSLALITFFMIHITNMRYAKWGYFRRYISPFPIFLPINLLSMWAPLLSLSFRLFGNAVAGWVLMQIVYAFLEGLSNALFGMPYFIAPIVTPLLHAYFDIFSGFIQTMVFLMLTMLFVVQEGPSEDAIEVEPVRKKTKKEKKTA